MVGEYSPEDDSRLRTVSPTALLDDERAWLAVALIAGSIVVASYYLSHPYPAYATALFPHMAEVLLENGYRRPEVVPLYTEGGLPFAYPPLMFYVMAVLIDIGIDPLLIVRLLPGVAFVLVLIPYFYLSREFVPVRQAGFATVIFAVAPQIVRWHISGGGTVRSPAVLFLVAGLYAGVRLFKTGDRRWVVAGAVLYGLTMLTHPVQMTYFGISYLVLFVAFDPSVRGLLNGAGVAVGGAIIGAPWWLYVFRTYGLDPILSASSTHGGLFESDFETILNSVVFFHDAGYPSETLIGFLVLAGAIYALSNRRYVLPVWFAVTAVVITQRRFAYIPGAMLIGMVVAGAVIPWLADVITEWRERRDVEGGRGPSDQQTASSSGTARSSARAGSAWDGSRDVVTAVALAALVLTTTWFGALYVAGDPPGEDRTPMGAYVDDDDIEAMEWVAAETPPDAQFAVTGGAAEWFPFVAERTSLVGWWGVEWTTPEQYDRQRTLHGELSACEEAACVNGTLDDTDLDPDYVYLQSPDDGMRDSMLESDRYELAYENEDTMIVRVTD